MVEVGDSVRFLNATGGGTVRRIQGQTAYVEDEDGFEMPVLVRELITVAAPKPAPAPTPKTAVPAAMAAPAPVPAPEEMPVEETADGDVPNIVLAIEPRDIKALQSTQWDITLVNDSNYYMAFAYAYRAKDDALWTPVRQGVIEPNIQLVVDTVEPDGWALRDHLSVQLLLYKADKPYVAQPPMAWTRRLDTTKPFKLHCYRSNPYFDTDVIAFDIVKDGKLANTAPQPAPKKATADPTTQLREKFNLPPREKAPRVPRAVPRPKPAAPEPLPKEGEPLVVDLHIAELYDNIHGMSPADILNAQIDKFREVMDAHLRHPGLKIVFIHGKGDGVLRQALLKELNYRYRGHRSQDAPFQEYGFGATQVTIAANPPRR